MTTTVITITLGRIDLTMRTLESFYNDNTPNYHYIFDNGSTEEDVQQIKDFFKKQEKTESMFMKASENVGIAKALYACVDMDIKLDHKTDLFLKLDNDIEMISPNLLQEVIKFYEVNGDNYVVAPRDINIDPNYNPKELYTTMLTGHRFTATTHVGGACMFFPMRAAKTLSKCKVAKDNERGSYLRKADFKVGYLEGLAVAHIGLNESIKDYKF